MLFNSRLWLGLFHLYMLTSTEVATRILMGQEREGRNLKEVFAHLSKYFAIKTYDDKSATNSSNVHLRALVEEGVFILQHRFGVLMHELPTNIQEANAIAFETISKENLVYHTVGIAFLLGMSCDLVANFVLEEKFFMDIASDQQTQFLYSFFTFYGVSFALQFLVGLESPFQHCSAADYVQTIQDFDFTLDAHENKTETEVLIYTKRLRFPSKYLLKSKLFERIHYRLAIERNLFCVTSKDQSFPGANKVNHKIEELLDIFDLHFKFKILLAQSDFQASQVDSLEAEALSAAIIKVDTSLHSVWSQLGSKVVLAYESAKAVIKNENIFRGIIGTLNLMGTICGFLRLAETLPVDKFPTLADIPYALLEDVLSLTQGKASNNFLVGDGIAWAAQVFWGYGFSTPFYGKMEDPDVGCGIHQFNDIERSYPEYTNFTLAFGTPDQILSDGNQLTLSTLPVFTVYRLKQFTRRLRNSLHCLISRSEPTAVDLKTSIDSWEELAILRMELTNSLRGL